MESSAEPSENPRRRALIIAAIAAVVLSIAAVVIWQVSGGVDEASAQTVTFEEPTAAGEDPFTKPADVKGPRRVAFNGTAPTDVDAAGGAGPFGGSGSDLVCDRELLLKSLLATPERMRAWAGVLGITPSESAISRYIRSLTPTTLTVDTRVTNHTYVNGRAVPLQSILAAGTAVLVDKYGRPVVRCRCGNPLLEPAPIKEATCTNCPPRYEPPPPCIFKPYRPWYDYPPELLPPAWRDPYPKGYPKPKYGTGKRGEPCYVLYPKPPKVYRPPPYQEDPEPPDTYEPEQPSAPTYTEPEYTAPQTDTYEEPPPEESPPDQKPQDSGDTYCYEADSPDRLEPGCQGTYGPPP